MAANAVNFDDEFFGPLKWDQECEWFSASVRLANGEPIEVTLVPKCKDEIKLFARETEKLFGALQKKLTGIYAVVREEYLKLYNESWAQAVNGYGETVGHGKISAAQFDDYVGLESIWFESDGSVQLFYYENNTLFGGHSIHVWLDDSLNVRSTGLEG